MSGEPPSAKELLALIQKAEARAVDAERMAAEAASSAAQSEEKFKKLEQYVQSCPTAREVGLMMHQGYGKDVTLAKRTASEALQMAQASVSKSQRLMDMSNICTEAAEPKDDRVEEFQNRVRQLEKDQHEIFDQGALHEKAIRSIYMILQTDGAAPVGAGKGSASVRDKNTGKGLSKGKPTQEFCKFFAVTGVCKIDKCRDALLHRPNCEKEGCSGWEGSGKCTEPHFRLDDLAPSVQKAAQRHVGQLDQAWSCLATFA